MIKKLLAFIVLSLAALIGFAQSASEKLQKSAEMKAAMDDYAGALVEIEKAVKMSPKSTQLLFTRGMIHYMQGNKSLADEDFNKVVEMPAKGADALRVKALSYNRLRNHKARDETFQELLAIDAKTAKDFLAHAVAHVSNRSYHEAIAMCDAAIEKDPKYVPAYIMRGSLRGIQRQVLDASAAIEDFKKAIELDPKNPELYYLLGRVQLESEKREDAIETLKKCSELAPESKRIQRLLRIAETGK